MRVPQSHVCIRRKPTARLRHARSWIAISAGTDALDGFPRFLRTPGAVGRRRDAFESGRVRPLARLASGGCHHGNDHKRHDACRWPIAPPSVVCREVIQPRWAAAGTSPGSVALPALFSARMKEARQPPPQDEDRSGLLRSGAQSTATLLQHFPCLWRARHARRKRRYQRARSVFQSFASRLASSSLDGRIVVPFGRVSWGCAYAAIYFAFGG
jgi:hypothetical protein